MTIKSNFPSIRPSLNLDFANTRALDPRITFTRTTTATYYDGKTTAKAEENLLLRSQEFENVAWGGGVGTTRTANTDTAPDGTTTADTITEDSATSIHVIVQAAAASGQVTLSVFAKAGSGSRFLTISVSRAATHYGSATFDLSTQTSTQTLIAGYSGSVTTAVSASTQGFYRYSITLTTDTISDVRIGLSATSTFANLSRGFDSYLGDGTSSLILWAAQLEQRSAVSAYTATTTAPITNYIPALQTAASGVARFDHRPLTGESLGLLVEEQRTNLLTYSDEFDNAAWTKTRSSITANTIVAPDGTLTGDKLVEDTTASNTHEVSRTESYTSGTNYTFTIYAKAAERSIVAFVGSNAAFGAVIAGQFNLSTGEAIVGTSGTNTSASMTSVGNGWWRCVFTAQATSTTSGSLIWRMRAVSGQNNYTGDGYSGLYIWGAQLEAGAFPTSYIPTVAASVTRNADVASMTGANFSSWYRADEGTLYCECTNTGNLGIGSPRPFSISDGTTSNLIEFYGSTATSIGFQVLTSGTTQANMAQTINSTTTNKLSAVYKVNDFAISMNATTASTDTSGTIPVASRADIGNRVDAARSWNGTLRKIAFYPSRLANAQLQALTAS